MHNSGTPPGAECFHPAALFNHKGWALSIENTSQNHVSFSPIGLFRIKRLWDSESQQIRIMNRPIQGEPWMGRLGASPQQLHGLDDNLEYVPDNREECHYFGGGIIIQHS